MASTGGFKAQTWAPYGPVPSAESTAKEIATLTDDRGGKEKRTPRPKSQTCAPNRPFRGPFLVLRESCVVPIPQQSPCLHSDLVSGQGPTTNDNSTAMAISGRTPIQMEFLTILTRTRSPEEHSGDHPSYRRRSLSLSLSRAAKRSSTFHKFMEDAHVSHGSGD